MIPTSCDGLFKRVARSGKEDFIIVHRGDMKDYHCLNNLLIELTSNFMTWCTKFCNGETTSSGSAASKVGFLLIVEMNRRTLAKELATTVKQLPQEVCRVPQASRWLPRQRGITSC
ncbi:hypothetical protein MLD38_010438 [Melastoma candidum]|uniref:Uncharacterized protein n=1 Tax=Melastoma candidum TaxID=119954 RepID=A0ACB9R3C9_9MYRT|nr:hypothetical protein MLD38_010438 [Melastoma candidum]